MGNGTSNFLTVNSGAAVTINGTLKTQKSAGFVSSTLGTTGGSIQFAGTQLITLGSNSTIDFNRGFSGASSAQTIDARTDYANLVLSNSGIASNKTFAAGTLSVSGALTVVDFLGSITQPATSTIIYSGSAAQTLPSAITTYSNLGISGSSTKTLSANTTVTGTLTFTSGKISTRTNTLTIGTAGSTSGGGSGTGWVIGNLKKATASGASPTFTYPLGDATNYLPLTLAFTGNTSADGGLTATVTAGDHAQSGYNNDKSVNRTWTLTNDALAGFGTYSATFNYAASDNDLGSTPANYKVQSYQNSSWTALTTTASPSQTTATATGIANFGDFAIAESLIQPQQGITEFYIDSVNGDDTNLGTLAAPWKNISKVNGFTLPAGFKIKLKAGSVWNDQQLKFRGSGTAALPIVVDKYEGTTKPIINGNGIATANQGVVYLYNQDYIEINNLEITNYPITPASTANPHNIFFVGISDPSTDPNPRSGNPLGGDRRGVMVALLDKGVCNHIYLNNLNIHHVKGQLGNGSTEVNGAIPKRTGGIYFTVLDEASSSNSRFNDIKINGCTISYCENIGLAFDNEDNVYYPGGNELALWTARKFTDIKVSNNIIHHIGKNAMIIRCTDESGLIQYNTCYETALGTTGNTMFTARAKGTVFQYNEGSWNRGTTQTVDRGDIDGSMYDPDYGSVGIIFQYSYSHDNSEGIYWGCNTRGGANNTSGTPDNDDVGCTLRYCISQNDKGDLIFFNYPSAGNEIYNNVFYIKEGLSSKIIHESSSKNHTYNFFNNIIFDKGDATYAWGSGAGVQTRDFKNNVFYGLPVPAEVSSNGNQILTSDPLFVNPGSGSSETGSLSINSLEGYKLKVGSPALANGKIISANGGFDYFGNSFSSTATPNRGAYEGAGFFPYFYSQPNIDLSLKSSWGLNTDGSGTPPDSFTADNQGFVIKDVTSTVNNNWTVSGTNSIVKVGYDAVAGKLAIPNGKTFTLGTGSSMIVSPLSRISGGTLNFSDRPVTLQSTVDGTASIGEIAGLSGATDVTVERYIPSGRRAFRLLTPSVTTTGIGTIRDNWQIGGATTTGQGIQITGSTTGANGFDATASGNPSMFTYQNNVDVTTTGWLAIPNTDIVTLAAGTGYRTLIRGDRNVNINVASTDNMNVATTLKATGTLKTGNVVFDGTSTPALNTTTNNITNGYSLIGNPYASPVDWELVTKSNIDDSYYTWDPNMGTSAERGRYVAYNASTHLATNSGSGTTGVNKYIQPGQAIFVRTLNTGTPALTFKESDKASTFTNVFRTFENSLLSVAVYNPIEVAFGSPIDVTTAVFGPVFNASVGYGDVEKLVSAGEHLAWSRGTKLLAMDATTPAVANDELKLKTIRFAANTSYTFKINTSNFDNSLSAYLVDQYLNTQTAIDLTAPNFMNFATTMDAASYGADRFKVVFSASSTLSNDQWDAKSLHIYPNPVVDNQFTIGVSSSITDKVTITIYNIIGQSVYQVSATPINNTIQVQPNVELKAGVYMVEMTNNGKTNTQKIIVK
jgi:hypothetical protein